MHGHVPARDVAVQKPNWGGSEHTQGQKDKVTVRKTQPVPGAVGAGADVGASHPACPGAIPITNPSCPNPGPGPAVTALTPSLGFLLHLLVKRVFEIAPRGRQYLRTRLRLHVEQLRAEVSLHVQAQRPCSVPGEALQSLSPPGRARRGFTSQNGAGSSTLWSQEEEEEGRASSGAAQPGSWREGGFAARQLCRWHRGGVGGGSDGTRRSELLAARAAAATHGKHGKG